MLYVGTVEAGIVAEAALGIDMCGTAARSYQLPGMDQPLNGDVLPDGGSGGIFEQAAQLRFADVEFLTDILQMNWTGQVFVDIAYNPVRQRVSAVISIFCAGNIDAVYLV